MIRKNNFLMLIPKLQLLMLFFLLSSCSVSGLFKKKVIPAWVETQVSDPQYFTGIGHAPVVKKQNNHIEKARADALNELASEISVQLFSSNVLVTLVNNDKIKDEFNSLIRSRVSTELEGYELVESYQDKHNYWVYYRLSKLKYYEQQRLKREAATRNAQDYFLAAMNAMLQHDHKNALINFAKTIDAVKLYLNENIISTVNGLNVNLVQQSFANIRVLIESLQIETSALQIDVMLTKEIDPAKLVFSLKDKSGNPVKAFPLTIYFSERAVPDPTRISDNQGTVQFQIPRIRSLKNEELITVTPDISRILLESSTDFAVRKAILDLPVKQSSVPVIIRKPTFRIVVDERVDGYMTENQPVGKVLSSQFAMAGYPVVERAEADYTAFVEVDTKTNRRPDGVYNSVLNGDIILIDKAEAIRYTTRLSPVKGMQLSPEKSAAEACSALLKQIENRYFREMIEAILK